MNTNKKIIGATVSTPLGIEAIKKLIGDIGGSGTPFHYTTQPTVGVDGIYEALNKEFCSSQDIKEGEIILHKFGLYKVVSVTDTYYSCTRIVTYDASNSGTQFHYSTEQGVIMEDNGQYGLNKKYCSSSSIKEGEVILHRLGLYKVVSSNESVYYCDVIVIFSGGGGSSTPLHYSNEPNPVSAGDGMILLQKIFCSSEDIKNEELIIYNGGLCKKLGGNDTQFLCDIVVGFSGGGGSSITITDISESTEDGGDNVVTFSDGKTLTVKNGNAGKTAYQYAKDGGYTGTEAQFSALLANAVDKRKITLGLHTDGLIYLFLDNEHIGNGIALPSGGVSGDVVGNVDSANNIILMGNLSDGTYTVKYEMEDGSTVNIGNLELGEVAKTYSIIKNLTNCSISNSVTSIIEGNSYSATISANSGYELKSVSVTMGGSPVSVSGGKISIASVTGDIVITATATEIAIEIVNLAVPDATATGETAWNSGGWCNNSYMAGSSYAYRGATDGKITTNIIAVEYNDVIYVKGITYNTGTFPQLAVFDESGTYKKHNYVSDMQNTNFYISELTANDGEDYWCFKNHGSNGYTDLGTRFIRIAGVPSGSIDDIIITRNQPIV